MRGERRKRKNMKESRINIITKQYSREQVDYQIPQSGKGASQITKQRGWEGGKRSKEVPLDCDPERAPAGPNIAKDRAK
jgi:hypothetical protein